MLNYLKKFAMDILPSVAATIIGAYIVNHYIVTKPGAEIPVAAAVSAADPKPAETTADVSNLPAAGVKAKGISEKAIMEKTAAERPTVVEKPQEKTQEKTEAKVEVKADAKSADTPIETASIPADPRRHQPAPREKIRVVLPSLVQPAVTTVVPAAAAPNPAPPALAVETTVAPDERRDANDLARAAIERLRGSGDNSPRVPEAARIPEAPRVATAPAVAAPAVRPLPPPIMVSAPPAGVPYGQASSQTRPPYAVSAETGASSRPTPPADIPVSRPLDLRAEVAEPSVRERTTAVAEDVLSTAKSLFHAVLPK